MQVSDQPTSSRPEFGSGEFRTTSGVYEIRTNDKQWIQWIALVLSMLGMLSAGLMSYGSLQTRIDHIESAIDKLDMKKASNERFGDVDRRLATIEENVNELLRRTSAGRKR